MEGVLFLNWRGCFFLIGGGAFLELEGVLGLEKGVLNLNWRGCLT